jgi:hypothetical protein
MNPIAAAKKLVSSLRWLVGSHEPRIARRIGMICPHGFGQVEVELLSDGAGGKPLAVLRCSAHDACPPTCDQACRTCVDAVLAPARAVIVYSHDGPFEDVG